MPKENSVDNPFEVLQSEMLRLAASPDGIEISSPMSIRILSNFCQ